MALIAGVLEVETAEFVACGWRVGRTNYHLGRVSRVRRAGWEPTRTLPSRSRQVPFSWRLEPFSGSRTVMLNCSRSLAAAFWRFWALTAWPTPVTVGMATIDSNPTTILARI